MGFPAADPHTDGSVDWRLWNGASTLRVFAIVCWHAVARRPGPVLRLAADENFNNDSVRGLIRRKPEVDIVHVQDVGLSGADDPTVLKWAAQLISVMGLPQSQLGLTIGAFMDS
jgi:hypothetical protein